MGLDLRMKGDTIPDQHHVARYCGPTQAPEGQIQATAFMLRKNDDSLSVNWMEFLNCSGRENEITELRTIYSTKLKRVAAGAIIAVLSVGEVREKVLRESTDRRNLKVLHDPETNDPSHSGIFNLRHDDEIIIAELILETVQETYPARK
jgi:hypothetical protein